ncbi:MAG: aspartate aminotransferase family protein, partial [Sulfurimonas sp.]
GDHGSTFGGNYLSTTAANTVLEVLNAYKESGVLDEMMLYFESKLRACQQEFPHLFLQSVGFGMMRGLRVKDADTLTTIINRSRDEGLLVLKAGKNTLRFLPPLTITKEEIDEGFVCLKRVIAAM